MFYNLFIYSFIYENLDAFHGSLLQMSYNNLLYLLPCVFTQMFPLGMNLDIGLLGCIKYSFSIHIGVDNCYPKWLDQFTQPPAE